MPIAARISLPAIAGLLSAVVSVAGARPMILNVLHRISTVEEVAVSPGGEYIAYTLEVQRDPFSEEQDGPSIATCTSVTAIRARRRIGCSHDGLSS